MKDDQTIIYFPPKEDGFYLLGDVTLHPPTLNFEIALLIAPEIKCAAYVPKTLKNRIKYGILCFFFPFKIKRWDK